MNNYRTDFPVVGLKKEILELNGKNLFSKNNIHSNYNENIRNYDKDFENISKTNILVFGNSFGRDVANIFLESSIKNDIEISYYDSNNLSLEHNLKKRWLEADLIIIATKEFIGKNELIKISKERGFKIDFDNIYCFGTKDFGYSNGIQYMNYDKIQNFESYFINLRKGTLEVEQNLKKE